jgi:hypothetical protein
MAEKIKNFRLFVEEFIRVVLYFTTRWRCDETFFFFFFFYIFVTLSACHIRGYFEILLTSNILSTKIRV